MLLLAWLRNIERPKEANMDISKRLLGSLGSGPRNPIPPHVI